MADGFGFGRYVVDRRMNELKRIARGGAWALLVGIGLFTADRVLFGPMIHSSWTRVGQLSDISDRAGNPILPPYLPDSLVWPPEFIFYRLPPAPGWWFGLVHKGTADTGLWLGTGTEPLPEPMKGFEPCFSESTEIVQTQCPAGWRMTSARIEGRMVYVLTRLEAQETKRIIVGLGLPSD